MAALAGIDLDAPRVARGLPPSTHIERAGQIVIHPDRVDPRFGREDAWHLAARQLSNLVTRPLGWDPHEQETPPPEKPAADRDRDVRSPEVAA